MIGNNSCGVHALMGGKTVDNIVALDLLLYDGTRIDRRGHHRSRTRRTDRRGGRTGEIYSELKRIRDTYADYVRTKFPRIPAVSPASTSTSCFPKALQRRPRPRRQRRHLRHHPVCDTAARRAARSSAPWSASAFQTSSSPRTLSRSCFDASPSASKASTACCSKRFAANKNRCLLKLLPMATAFCSCEFGADTQSESDHLAASFAHL
jgi:hypothetical protein